jgi:hypothetical protein
MYYYNEEYPKERGFAIHGTWWHADFGKPASHGCINLPVDDARELFFWTDPQVGALEEATATGSNPGTRVVVFDSATRDAVPPGIPAHPATRSTSGPVRGSLKTVRGRVDSAVPPTYGPPPWATSADSGHGSIPEIGRKPT